MSASTAILAPDCVRHRIVRGVASDAIAIYIGHIEGVPSRYTVSHAFRSKDASTTAAARSMAPPWSKIYRTLNRATAPGYMRRGRRGVTW